MSLRSLDAVKQARSEGRAYQDPTIGTDEPFYRNETMAELGDSWESQVFGGKISWSSQSTSGPLFVCKWPSFLPSEDGYPKRGKEKSTPATSFPTCTGRAFGMTYTLMMTILSASRRRSVLNTPIQTQRPVRSTPVKSTGPTTRTPTRQSIVKRSIILS